MSGAAVTLAVLGGVLIGLGVVVVVNIIAWRIFQPARWNWRVLLGPPWYLPWLWRETGSRR